MTDWPFGELKRAHYRTVYIDPPGAMSGGKKSRPQHYSRMTDAELGALPIKDLCHPDGANIFVWINSPKLFHYVDIARAGWGVRFSSRAFIWIKTLRKWSKGDQEPMFVAPDALHFSLGYTTRKNAEDVLLFKVGKPRRMAKDVRELVFAPPREHSRKPEEVRKRIERYSEGPRAELFARVRTPGWDSWGNQLDRFAAESEREG